MIKRLEIEGIHMSLDPAVERYARKKIGQLDRFVPRAMRESLHAEIKLKEDNAKDKRHATCEVILHVPHETIRISETALNIYAAIDIVEAKLRNQLHKYKDLHTQPRLHRKLLRSLRMKR